MLWFDGAWLAHGGTAWEPKRNPEFTQDEIFLNPTYFWESEKVINMIRELQPDIILMIDFAVKGTSPSENDLSEILRQTNHGIRMIALPKVGAGSQVCRCSPYVNVFII